MLLTNQSDFGVGVVDTTPHSLPFVEVFRGHKDMQRPESVAHAHAHVDVDVHMNITGTSVVANTTQPNNSDSGDNRSPRRVQYH